MSHPVTIRPCTPSEHDLVLELWKDWTLPGATDDLEALKILEADGENSLLVAEDAEGLAGTVVAGFDGWRGNIYRLAVRPRDRRKGIGSALVDAAEARLAARGARRVSALVLNDDLPAQGFWNALGDSGFRLDPRVIRYVKML